MTKYTADLRIVFLQFCLFVPFLLINVTVTPFTHSLTHSLTRSLTHLLLLMIVCYPPSASGYRGWRSTEDVVYPQEVGFHCVSERVSDGVSGELLLEVREQWCPASVDVYLGE